MYYYRDTRTPSAVARLCFSLCHRCPFRVSVLFLDALSATRQATRDGFKHQLVAPEDGFVFVALGVSRMSCVLVIVVRTTAQSFCIGTT